ncbi:conserved hypothetical protein [Ricinus communis]|uniref:Uncharacterized protein n=1 Tax=Ricinus communis TaxID=3988 RepID=B9TB79_RICCO|nr:conserved hypothetical protein [Ricinus communis]
MAFFMKVPILKRIGRAIRKLRKEAESTLLSAQGDQGFPGIRPSQAHSRDPHEAWE